MTVQESEPLLPRIARGDASAVRECIDRYGSLLWSLVRRSVGDASQAEDVVQEIFIALWKAAARFDASVASETTYVMMIARRKIIDRFRRAQRVPEAQPIEDVTVPHADPGLERVETSDEAAQAARVLQELRPEHRRVLEMWIVDGLTHAQISEATGLPLGTVKSHARRGLIQVRERIDAERTARTGGPT